MLVALLLAGVINYSEKHDLPRKWKSFCERHLAGGPFVDDDGTDLDEYLDAKEAKLAPDENDDAPSIVPDEDADERVTKTQRKEP